MPSKPDNRPDGRPSSETLWEMMNKPIGFDSMKELFGGKDPESKVLPNLEQQADKLIEKASRVAAKQGISIEDALANLGFAVKEGNGDAAGSGAAGMKNTVLQSLDWEVTQSGDTTPPDVESARLWLRRGTDIITIICKKLSLPNDELVVEALSQILPGDELLRQKLFFTGFCTPEDFQAAEQRFQQQGGQFWRHLLSNTKLNVELFTEILLTLPYMPLVIPGKGIFYESLLEKGVVSYSDFKSAKAKAKQTGQSVCRLLSHKEILGPNRFSKALSEFSGCKFRTEPPPKMNPKLASMIKRAWIELFDIVPLQVKRAKLVVGASIPVPESFLNLLASETGGEIEFELLTPDRLAKIKETVVVAIEGKKHVPISREEKVSGRIRHIVASASAVNVVRQLFEGALEARATDIHLEPEESRTRVRFRIDGMCYEVMKMDPELAGEVASRIKVLADLDITERRNPQDGHIRVNIHGREYDMRIATVPVKYGEKIGIRLVYAGRVMKKMGELGLSGSDYEKVKRLISMPHGMILATGPVGSGKTTTLYSCLNEIDRQSRNVMSIEDPIEFALPGANQVEASYKMNFGFVEGLRALLRQDPDTILIGEIRDEETAKIAVRASMTGLLVFSTLHTNDAPGAVTALYNFHLPTHLIANSILGVVAQRLLRKICLDCKAPYSPSRDEIAALGFSSQETSKGKPFFKGKGCAKCYHTGYLDRIGVFELMNVTPLLRDLILEERSEKDIRAQAIKEGMRTLAMDGREKVLNGETTSEEFLRVLSAQNM